ncbi:FAD-binding oxidoreductase [Kitasatospora sp. NPDC094015]|uniref:FAD-binding oxidoreductase n=1 Tax=Kitasatospora sp. NPDC094015 TaxID=3155205 RepID=UPI003329F211
MTSDLLDSGMLAGLRSGLVGEAIGPGDAGYDGARAVFNGMVDRRPRVMAQCVTPRDVATAVSFARSHGLELSVRGGGHGVTGAAVVDDGLVVDLRRMNAVDVDPQAKIARVGGGATMADLDRATQPHALATTGGRASTTGVGGLTLGGGSGWLERRYGLMCDNLLAAELVTADGRRVRASEQEHPELFWALHGGGGNFGVVTEFTLGLHPLPAFSIALLLWPTEAGPEVIRRYRDYMDEAPDEVGGAVLYLTAPPEPFVPPELVGRQAVGMLLTYTGVLGQARPVFEPMLGLGHAGEVVAELPYADVQRMLDDPPGYRNYWSAEYLAGFPDQAADLFCARARDMVTPSPSQHVLFPLGGAVAAGRDDYPLPWRTASWAVHPFGLWEDRADDERGRAWARAVRADLEPWSVGAVYLNFIGDEGADRTRAGLGERNTHRLAAVKAAYDPDDVFRASHPIARA